MKHNTYDSYKHEHYEDETDIEPNIIDEIKMRRDLNVMVLPNKTSATHFLFRACTRHRLRLGHAPRAGTAKARLC